NPEIYLKNNLSCFFFFQARTHQLLNQEQRLRQRRGQTEQEHAAPLRRAGRKRGRRPHPAGGRSQRGHGEQQWPHAHRPGSPGAQPAAPPHAEPRQTGEDPLQLPLPADSQQVQNVFAVCFLHGDVGKHRRHRGHELGVVVAERDPAGLCDRRDQPRLEEFHESGFSLSVAGFGADGFSLLDAGHLRHSSGSFHFQRHRSAVLLPPYLQDRPRLRQGNRRREKNERAGVGGGRLSGPQDLLHFLHDKETDENEPLLRLRRLCGQTGSSLHLDQRLHRSEEPSLLRALPGFAGDDGSLDVLWLHRVLVQSLCAAVRGTGPVGRRVCSDWLLSLAARHFLPGLLPHILVLHDPAAAALPDRLSWTDHIREKQPNEPPEETGTDRLSETESIQFGRGEEPGLLLPAEMLRSLQTGRHRLDAAVPARLRPAHVRTPRHGLTPHSWGQGSEFNCGSGPKAQCIYLFL
ncbi:hypothetical protein LDENG_00216270, partial [Lucifuga dentata]